MIEKEILKIIESTEFTLAFSVNNSNNLYDSIQYSDSLKIVNDLYNNYMMNNPTTFASTIPMMVEKDGRSFYDHFNIIGHRKRLDGYNKQPICIQTIVIPAIFSNMTSLLESIQRIYALNDYNSIKNSVDFISLSLKFYSIEHIKEALQFYNRENETGHFYHIIEQLMSNEKWSIQGLTFIEIGFFRYETDFEFKNRIENEVNTRMDVKSLKESENKLFIKTIIESVMKDSDMSIRNELKDFINGLP